MFAVAMLNAGREEPPAFSPERTGLAFRGVFVLPVADRLTVVGQYVVVDQAELVVVDRDV